MKLPQAIIIGAQKCATTGLIYTLNYHPDVWCAHEMNYINNKIVPPENGGSELDFFSENWDKGIRWYSDWFSPGKDLFCIEKSPSYFVHSEVPERIKLLIPDCKLILMVRDPVYRAFSAYNHIQQQKSEWAKQIVGVPFMESTVKYPKLLHDGCYFDHLHKWLEFFPKDQILIIAQEKLVKQYRIENDKILNFLGLKITKLPNHKSHVRSYDGRTISLNEKKELQSYFKSHNEKLFDFLGYRFEEWM
jgi:hypothetical protein